jgi:hypothetical protein
MFIWDSWGWDKKPAKTQEGRTFEGAAFSKTLLI